MKRNSDKTSEKDFVLCFQDEVTGKMLNVYSSSSETCLDYLDKLYNFGRLDICENPDLIVMEDFITNNLSSFIDLGILGENGEDSDNDDDEGLGSLFFGFI